MSETPRPFVIGAAVAFIFLLMAAVVLPAMFFAGPDARLARTFGAPEIVIRHKALTRRHLPADQDPSFVPPKPRMLADVKRAKARYEATFARLGRRARCLPISVRKVLARLSRDYGHVRIISTFRRGATIAGTNTPSYHRYCRAVDFKITRQAAAVRWLKRHWRGGVGTYSGSMHHVHIDNGRRVRFHKYVGRTGRRVTSRRVRYRRRGFGS